METEWITVNGMVSDEDDQAKGGCIKFFTSIVKFLEERRLPCHMYLNGCPRSSSISSKSIDSYLCHIILLLIVIRLRWWKFKNLLKNKKSDIFLFLANLKKAVPQLKIEIKNFKTLFTQQILHPLLNKVLPDNTK